MMDLLDNMPRLRLSEAHMRLILWVMKESGCPDVPSLYKLRRTQQSLQETMGVRTRQYRSQLGNIFFMNDIPQMISKVGTELVRTVTSTIKLIGAH